MSRRTFEGHMDWEYQNPPPVDASSPFTKFRSNMAPFDSPSKFTPSSGNPFAKANAGASVARDSPTKSQPPHAAFFNPQLRQPTAPSFRNPAFNTPRKPYNDVLMSDMSGIESSPAMTDVSETPADDTPDVDRTEHTADDLNHKTITPSVSRALFARSTAQSLRATGRGEVPRGDRSKVRKRKRQLGDRDVGSVRPRLGHDSDESDSDWEGDSKSHRSSKRQEGWLGSFLSVISKHPTAPAILSEWMNLSVNLVLILSFLSLLYLFVHMVRTDIAAANEYARSALLEEIRTCGELYVKNRCSPDQRVPAMDGQCKEWDLCMHKDTNAIKYATVSATSAVQILNEFVTTMHWKVWIFLSCVLLVAAMAKAIASSSLRPREVPPPQMPPMPFPSQGIAPAYVYPNPGLFLSPYSKRQRHLALAEDTDTDNSPAPIGMIMAPKTPSRRRSPSRGERTHSPTKNRRSPSKDY